MPLQKVSGFVRNVKLNLEDGKGPDMCTSSHFDVTRYLGIFPVKYYIWIISNLKKRESTSCIDYALQQFTVSTHFVIPD